MVCILDGMHLVFMVCILHAIHLSIYPSIHLSIYSNSTTPPSHTCIHTCTHSYVHARARTHTHILTQMAAHTYAQIPVSDAIKHEWPKEPMHLCTNTDQAGFQFYDAMVFYTPYTLDHTH